MEMSCKHSLIISFLFLSAGADISYAGHPLLTEDTNTQGKGKYQLELTNDYSDQYGSDTKTLSRNTSGILTLGVTVELDLIFTLPHERVTQRVDSYESTVGGLADLEIGLKWRFYEVGAFSFAVRPGLGLGSGGDSEDAPFGRVTTTSLYGAMSYHSDPWTFHSHVGYTRDLKPVLRAKRNTFHGSIASEFSVNEQLRFVGDLGVYQSGGNIAKSVVVGIIYSLTPDLDLDLGYRKVLVREAPERAWLTGVALRF